jgi:hypothetical protein
MKTLLVLSAFLVTQMAYGFGSKKMNFVEVSGKSEAQVVQGENLNLMIRGRAAELFFKMSQGAVAKLDSEALPAMKAKAKSHWAWTGKQIACSKVTDEKQKKDEYACGFTMAAKGNMSGLEPFSPAVFNLAQTNEKSTLFKKAKGRGLASAPAFDKATAFVMFDKPGEKMNSKEVMVVIRGKAANQIIDQLAASPDVKKFQKGPVQGVRGDDIACVYANGNETERCSFVVSMDDGSVKNSHNPLFH